MEPNDSYCGHKNEKKNNDVGSMRLYLYTLAACM